MNLEEVQHRVHRIAHWIDVETEIPVLYKYTSELQPGQIYFEIGTGLGCSAIIAALSSQEGVQVWTVDIGMQYVDKVGSLKEYMEKVYEWFDEYGVQDKIVFMCKDANELKWRGVIHCLFIDGNHDYENVKKDMKKWLPLLAVGGVVIFHDYYCIHTPGVKQAVNELMDNWQPMEGGGSMKVLGKTR